MGRKLDTLSSAHTSLRLLKARLVQDESLANINLGGSQFPHIFGSYPHLLSMPYITKTLTQTINKVDVTKQKQKITIQTLNC